ncbi:DUF1772 domain-containing protein [Undibacterium pigrum]|uniref:Putative membrane protein n=1 Tax=Undibacterium pigrum TaxID=401470 RepID=A0A318IT74_9BURK|nr:anthrone oxygenase family protein [Undibacterium pigrum]PXX38699.1 putative membrane protein [Undibacterium pigrum]
MINSLVFVSALGGGLMAGFFFAFSVLVMKALSALSPAQGISAMQSINIVVINPWFMTPFLGMAVLSGVLITMVIFRWQETNSAYVFAGGLLYLLGTLGVTIAFNVPRNEALAAVVPDSTEAARLWAGYLTEWTRWNHVRTIAALASSVALTIALLKRC